MQKVQDLVLLLRREKKAQLLGGMLALGLLFICFSSGKQPQLTSRRHWAGSGTTATEEAYLDLVRAFNADLEGVKADVSQFKVGLELIEQNQRDFEGRTAEIFKKMLERLELNDGSTSRTDTIEPVEVQDPDALGNGQETLVVWGEEQSAPQPLPPASPRRVAFVGAGDSVSVQLLTGVNVPTDGPPYPVVFKLVDDVDGPDGSQLPLGEARLIAAAQGSLSDSRALFRLTSLNIRMPSGRRKVVPVDGWIVGEDGIRGMEGVLIDPMGRVIGGAGFAGLLEGIGEGVAAANSTVTQGAFGTTQSAVTGDVAQFSAGKGVSSAAKTYAGLIKDRLKELVSAVQVRSNRHVTAIFSKSIMVEDLIEELEQEDSGYY